MSASEGTKELLTHKAIAVVGNGSAWLLSLATTASALAPIAQVLSYVLAGVASFFTARYFYKQTKKSK